MFRFNEKEGNLVKQVGEFFLFFRSPPDNILLVESCVALIK